MLEQAAEAGDEYVDIGDEMPTVNYQSVEIEKDAQMASSSSESGSGSSSSNGMKDAMTCTLRVISDFFDE
jgi:hypothetical protein